MDESCIAVRGLRKSYAGFEAVRGIDFEVGKGVVFGLLGPNGAGKTTTVEILEGLRPRSAGEIDVLGYDPGLDARSLKQRIGVCLQATNLPEKIRVIEAVQMFASFYDRNVDGKKLLERLQLAEKSQSFYSTLSGGQKQRVALALALVNDPQLLFLDEPTTGLDPQVRLEIHGLIQELKDAKRTIILTTHYIEEAERLCDQVAIMDQGRIIASGTPRELQERTLGQSRVEVVISAAAPEPLPAFRDDDRLTVSEDRRKLTLQTPQPARGIVDIVKWVDQTPGLELIDIHLKRPTLEDVFIELTGKSLRD